MKRFNVGDRVTITDKTSRPQDKMYIGLQMEIIHICPDWNNLPHYKVAIVATNGNNKPTLERLWWIDEGDMALWDKPVREDFSL